MPGNVLFIVATGRGVSGVDGEGIGDGMQIGIVERLTPSATV